MFKFNKLPKISNLFEIAPYNERNEFMKMVVWIFTITANTVLFPISALLAMTNFRLYEKTFLVFINTTVRETSGSVLGVIFGIFASVIYAIIFIIAIVGNCTNVKSPQYLYYDEVGNIVELREFIYVDGNSYEYCYYTPDFYLPWYDGCWFNTKHSKYNVVFKKSDIITYMDINGKPQNKMLVDIPQEDIIRNFKLPIPEKPVRKEKVNF